MAEIVPDKYSESTFPEGALTLSKTTETVVHIWDNMCMKNSDKIDVLFSPSLLLQSALLCHPGSLEMVCSWTTPQCESPQVTSLAKSKCHFIFRHFFFNFKRTLLLNR